MGERRVLLGRIVGVHGVHGAVKLESFTAPRSAIFDYTPWLVGHDEGRCEEVVEVHGRTQGKGLVAMLPGVTDRDAAAGLTGTRIWVLRSALPELEAGEFYQTDLEGLRVGNLAGDDLGRVSHLFDNGGHDVLVTRDAAGCERLIPYVAEVYIKSVDLIAGRVLVDWDKDY